MTSSEQFQTRAKEYQDLIQKEAIEDINKCNQEILVDLPRTIQISKEKTQEIIDITRNGVFVGCLTNSSQSKYWGRYDTSRGDSKIEQWVAKQLNENIHTLEEMSAILEKEE